MTENNRLTFKKPAVESAPVGATATHTRIVTHGHRPVHPTALRPPRERRRMSTEMAVGIAVGVLALVALGVITAIYRQKRTEARFEAYSLRNQRDRAYAAYDKIAPFVAKAEEANERVDARIAAAKDDVAFVTGIPFAAHMAPRRATTRQAAPSARQRSPTAAAPVRAPLDGLSVVGRETIGGRESPEGLPTREELDRRRAKPTAQQPVAPVRAEPAAAPLDGLSVVGRESIGGRESPEGILTREELDRRRAKPTAQQPVAPAPAPEKTPAVPTEEPTPTPAPAPTPATPAAPAPTDIVGVVRSMVRNREQMAENFSRMIDAQTQADEKRTEAAKARESVIAAAAAAAIEEHVLKIEHLSGLSDAAAELTEQDAVRCQTLRAAELAAREARAAEEKRLREAEELRQRIADEKRRAVELHANTEAQARSYAFAEALAGLEAARPSFGTAEGLADLAVHIDRFRRLARQKEALILSLNNEPFRWGWGLTAAASKDVLSADEQGVTITGAFVPWADVSVPQLLKFLDHYGRAPDRRLSERADDSFTTAILLDELGLRDEARTRVSEAVEEADHLRNEVNRLMPGLL